MNTTLMLFPQTKYPKLKQFILNRFFKDEIIAILFMRDLVHQIEWMTKVNEPFMWGKSGTELFFSAKTETEKEMMQVLNNGAYLNQVFVADITLADIAEINSLLK